MVCSGPVHEPSTGNNHDRESVWGKNAWNPFESVTFVVKNRARLDLEPIFTVIVAELWQRYFFTRRL